MNKFLFLNIFCEVYDLSLFISVRAFLPSLRVFKTSQDEKEIIKMESIKREIKVESVLKINLPEIFKSF